jgi:hypothetical protein
MAIQTGVALQVAFKKESAFGVLPTNDSAARFLRRVTTGLALSKSAFQSEEVRPDYQVGDMRHGLRAVGGDLVGELSLATYADFIAAACRRNFAAVSSLSALTNVTASAAAPHFVRGSGSWITDGLRVGMVIRMTGWTTTAVGNNSKNFTIVALTATNMTVAETVVAKAAGDSVVVSIPGKVTYVPASGHTNDSFSVEHWAPDAAQSHRFTGCKVNSLQMALPPNDKAQVTIGFMGRDRAKAGAQYFSSASAVTTSPMLSGLQGALFVNGAQAALVTNASISLNGNLATTGVVGDNRTPDVFAGRVDVSGQISVLFQDGVFDGYFDDETEVSLVLRLSADTLAAGDFMTITLPRIKLAGGQYQDSQQAMTQQFDFTALKGASTAGGFQDTTIMFQDSLA